MSANRNKRQANRKECWQFSLRTLLLLTVVAGPVIGLGGPPLYRIVTEVPQPMPPPTVPVDSEPICVLYEWHLDPDEDIVDPEEGACLP